MDSPFDGVAPSTNGSSPHVPRTPDGPPPQPAAPRSPLFKLILYLVLIAFIVPVLAGVIAALAHLGPFANHLFPVTVHNDTSATVVVRACSTTCLPGDQSVELKPGGKVDVGVSDGAQVTPFYLHDPDGALLSCLPLQAARRVTGAVVQVSQAESCPGTPISVG